MKREELWKIYVAKNPRFDQPEEMITMPAKSVKKLFEQTWEQAVKETASRNNGMADFMKKMGL